MELLLVLVFFLVFLIFFVAGKDDFGRKEIKLNSDQEGKVKNDLNDEVKEEVKKEVE